MKPTSHLEGNPNVVTADVNSGLIPHECMPVGQAWGWFDGEHKNCSTRVWGLSNCIMSYSGALHHI